MIILDSEVKECIDWMIKTFNTKILFEYRDNLCLEYKHH